MGVYIEEIGEQYTHCQFVDDTSVVIKAERRYMDQVFETFRVMGQVFGLFIEETHVKVVYISPTPC